jgi:hypothetical protein
MPGPHRYKFFGGRRTQLASSRELFVSPYTDLGSIHGSDVIKAAVTCRQFDSLDGHAQRLKELCKGTPIEEQDWRSILDKATAGDVLVPENAILELIERHVAIDKPARKITQIAIPTRNRPAMLRRILGQLADHLHETADHVSVITVDSSESEAVQEANREIVAEAKSSKGLAVRYSGQASRSRYSRCLSEITGIPARITRFAIAPEDEGTISTGSCRNAVLLETQGQHVLFLDDDVHCLTMPVPGSTDQLTWGANKDSFHTWFLDSEPGTNSFPPRLESLLRLHEDVFNWNKAKDGGANSVEHLSRRLLGRLQAGEVDVVASSLGVIGDPGTDSPMSLFLSGSETLQRMFLDDHSYEHATHERLVLQGPRSTIISEDIGCMSYCIALDNSAVLPPFCPLQRAAEFVFASLVQQCAPDRLFAAVPRAILHTPATRRRFDDHAIATNAGRFTAGEILVALIKRQTVTASSRPHAIRAVGNYLRDIALLDDVTFQRLLRDALTPLIVQWIQLFDDVIHLYCGSLPRATDDLRRAQQSALQILNSTTVIVPSDIQASWGLREAHVRFRSLISNFGELLLVWPELVEANRSLRSRGLSLCESCA